jgi:uncharacterized surface protein with fasciclin (FAS1) repeats
MCRHSISLILAMLMKKSLVLVLCCALCAAILCCGKKRKEEPRQGEPPAPGNIVEIVSGDGRFSTLSAAIDAAGLAETLSGKGPFTLFAPPDSVFAKLPPGAAESLLQDVPVLKNILLYHVVPGKLTTADLRKIPPPATLLGIPLAIWVTGEGAITIGGAPIARADVPASNGVIHVIDKVLLPPTEP